MTPLASPGDALRPVRVAFTASVGSHLDTARYIEGALRSEIDSLACTIIDLVGFSRWDAREVPYAGDSERLSFDLAECGVDNPSINSFTWPAVLRGATKLMGRIEPDLLVTMDDSWYDQHALILGAQRAGVPAVLVQEGPFTDGIALGRPARRRLSLSRSALMESRAVRRLRGRPLTVRLPSYGRGDASVVLAVSDWYKSRFVEAGVTPHRVQVTGVPRYDAIPRLRQRCLERRLAGSSEDPPRALLLSQPFVRYKELSETEYSPLAAIARQALAEVADLVGATIEVRMHPSDREHDMDALVGDQLKATLVAPTQPLVETLASYDVVVGFTSSGLLEAMAIGVPVVVIEAPQIAWRTRFFRDVGLPVATDVATAVRQISGVLASRSSPELPSRLMDEVGVLDGMASKRVARQCRRQLARSRSS
jgi:hypothetical protein